MKALKIINLIFCLALSAKGIAQSNFLDVKEKIDDFRIVSRSLYKDENGNFYGAGTSVDALNILSHFKEALFDLKTDSIKISGITFQTLLEDDLRLNGVKIFTAIPKNGKLKNIEVIGYSNSSALSNGMDGIFDFKFRVKKKRRLYFDGGESFYLLEYDLWKMKKSVKNKSKAGVPITITRRTVNSIQL